MTHTHTHTHTHNPAPVPGYHTLTQLTGANGSPSLIVSVQDFNRPLPSLIVPRAREPALSGVPGVGAATAGTFGGLGGAVHRQVCREGLQVASTEGERSILQGLVAGATWTAGRAAGHAILRSDKGPFCRGAPEMEPHILWDCPHWESARRTWMLWVLQEARALPVLALPAVWLVCLRATGLLPLGLVGAGEDAQAGRLLYRLYGMYLAVLSARRAVEEAAKMGGDAASTVFGPTWGRGPDSRQGYGWGQLADGLLRPAPARDPLQLPQGPLAGWPWERGFAEALVS